jgi:hypothetical protein
MALYNVLIFGSHRQDFLKQFLVTDIKNVIFINILQLTMKLSVYQLDRSCEK